MKSPQPGQRHYFVDESGDATFFGRGGRYIVGSEGCSPILILGFVETLDPVSIRRALLALQQEIISDPYFDGPPSLSKTAIAFHAKDDLPEVRYLVYQLLATLDFKAQFVVGRKLRHVFENRFGCDRNRFYDELLSYLFKRVLHRYEQNSITFATRGSRSRQGPFEDAIRKGVSAFERQYRHPVRTQITVTPQTPKGEPCLQVIDYLNWAVYRAYCAEEMRYYRAIEDKVSLLIDLYDQARHPSNNWYNRRNPFDIRKATPLQLGS